MHPAAHVSSDRDNLTSHHRVASQQGPMDDGNLGDTIQDETEVIEESVAYETRMENDDAHLAPR